VYAHVDLDAPVLRTHDRTGERVRGNQAVNWHIASLPERIVASQRRLYGTEDRLPKHATFGDGTPIPDADVRHIIDVLKSEETAFPWQRGDVLLCDNQRIARGRRPFKGERRVLVAPA
jgi:alpha-ketoglutarate-dependent taurine dioxygenase